MSVERKRRWQVILAAIAAFAAPGPTSAQEPLPPSAATSLAGSVEEYVPGRRVAVLSLAATGDPRTRRASELREIIEAQLGYPLPRDAATDIELRQRAIAAYDGFGGAYVRDLPDGRQYCIAMVGRPFEHEARVIAAIAGGLPRGAAVRRDFVAAEADIQRFLAYHEIGGHCGDRSLTPWTGMDMTPREGYEHSMAELRADIFAVLATARDDGDTAAARTMLALRRSYALQAAVAPSCNTSVNYGAVYRTAPGIAAAIDWAESTLRGAAGAMGTAELIEQADRIFAAVRPSYDLFLAFERRIERAKAAIGTADPLDVAARGASLGIFQAADRAWLEGGVSAMRKVFELPEQGVTAPGPALHCPPEIAKRSDEPRLRPPPVLPAGGAGLGG